MDRSEGEERCVQQMLDHIAEYPSPTAAAEAVAKRNGVEPETVRGWFLQAQVDRGQRHGAAGEDLAEIKELKARVRRLEEDNDILRRASTFFAGGARPPRSLIVAFIDECRQAGHAVESICRVLTGQGMPGRRTELPDLEPPLINRRRSTGSADARAVRGGWCPLITELR